MAPWPTMLFCGPNKITRLLYLKRRFRVLILVGYYIICGSVIHNSVLKTQTAL